MENSSTIRRFRLAHPPRQPEERPPNRPCRQAHPLNLRTSPFFHRKRVPVCRFLFTRRPIS